MIIKASVQSFPVILQRRQYLVYLPSLGASQKSEYPGWLWPSFVSAPPAVSEKITQDYTQCLKPEIGFPRA